MFVVIFADFVFDKAKQMEPFTAERRIDTSDYGCLFKFNTREDAEKAVESFHRLNQPRQQVNVSSSFYSISNKASIPVAWNVNIPADELEEACTQTGLSPIEKGVAIGRLTATWNHHPPGSIVITGPFTGLMRTLPSLKSISRRRSRRQGK